MSSRGTVTGAAIGLLLLGAGVRAATPSPCAAAKKTCVMHGLADTCFPFAGGSGSQVPGFRLPSIPDTIARWAALDGCAPTTTVTRQTGAATCVSHEDCAPGTDVTLCTVAGLGHGWPGSPNTAPGCGGAPVPDLVANDALWDFFTAHPMR
jgi:polyhydroxybutyrate depolymerase